MPSLIRVRLSLTLVCLLSVASPTPAAEKIRLLLDTDANNELDDQHAIAYTLFNGDVFDVEGITVNATFNGGGIEEHLAEAQRVVAMCGQAKGLPVIAGAAGDFETIAPHVAEPVFDGHEAIDFIIERALADDPRPLVLMPVGKLTNIALALVKRPEIAKRVRIVWLGSNYPDPGEYNFDNDIGAMQPIVDSGAPFEMVMVRYGKPSGTDAVKATLVEIRQRMPGLGPRVEPAVPGRHGGAFTNFGDYSVELFTKFEGHPTERPLFDMAAVAIVKNPAWAERVEIGAPRFEDGAWVDRPDNPRRIVVWENFDRRAILEDFYESMEEHALDRP